MMRRLLAILIIVIVSPVWAEELPVEHMVLSKAPVDPGDLASIKRGATFFAANCLSCHTMKYLRYNKLAQEAGITYEKMPFNVKNWPNGIVPPDLSLEASARGVDWIYTYLHSFYKDTSRPMGVNNLLVPNTGMSGILTPYQGTQVRITDDAKALKVGVYQQLHWYNLLVLESDGTMSPDEFDATIVDIVNFLDYAAEPYRMDQHRIGMWVLGFLVILFVLMYLLKREYWKDVKKHKNDKDE